MAEASWGQLAEIQPHPPSGLYELSGVVEPVMRIDVQTVYGFTSRGREQLKALKKEGYRCSTLPRQTFRCSQQSELLEVTDEMVDKALSKAGESRWFDFSRTPIAIEEVVNNETFKMWRVHSRVVSALGRYPNYEMTWTPEISKVVLRDENEALPTLYLNQQDDGGLSSQVSIAKTFSKEQFQIYILRVLYSVQD